MIKSITTRIAGRTKSLSLRRYRYVALVLLFMPAVKAVKDYLARRRVSDPSA